MPAKATFDIDDETGTLEVQMPSVTADEYRATFCSALEYKEHAAQIGRVLAQVNVCDRAATGTQTALGEAASSIDEATFRRAMERLGSSRSVDGGFRLGRNPDTDAPLQTTDKLSP